MGIIQWIVLLAAIGSLCWRAQSRKYARITLTVFVLCFIMLADFGLYRLGHSRVLRHVVELQLPCEVVQPWKDAYSANMNQSDNSLFTDMFAFFGSDQFSEVIIRQDHLLFDDLLNVDRGALTYGNQWWVQEGFGTPWALSYWWKLTANEEDIEGFSFEIRHSQEKVAKRLAVYFRQFVIAWYLRDKDKFGLTRTLKEDDFVQTSRGSSATDIFGRLWFLYPESYRKTEAIQIEELENRVFKNQETE